MAEGVFVISKLAVTTNLTINYSRTNLFLKCIICPYWYLNEINFKFHPKVSNGCHGLMLKAMSFNVATVSVKGNGYRIHIWYMS